MMKKIKIPTVEGLIMLLLLGTDQANACAPCICYSSEDIMEECNSLTTLKVDCSSKGLKEVPALPFHTKILSLQNNSLATIPPGTLDSLSNVEEIDLSNNPWNCDCSILYLKLWLEDSNRTSLDSVKCATPASVKMKTLSQLTGNELEGCRKPLPIKCLDFFWRDLGLVSISIFMLIIVCWVLQLAKKLSYQVTTKLHSSEVPLLQAHDLENQKSK